MASKNLYLKDSDQETFAKAEALLEKQGRSLSEFLAEAVSNLVAASHDITDIELVGAHRKRIFQGTQLYRACEPWYEEGVFRTARGAYVYWWKNEKEETFKTYDDLDELHTDNVMQFDDLMWEGIEEANAALDGRVLIDRLDI